MRHITKRSLGSTLLVGSLTCVGYLAAQQGPSQQSKRTQSDRLEQLETRVKDLEAAMDNLSAVCAQDRRDLEQAQRTVGRDEKQIDKLGQQVSKIMLELDRVKTKVGLY